MITAFPACAQESAKEDKPITVTGKKPQNSIDRQSYDNKSIDTAGSAADALNKVPSVTVDANGNVALRGNKDVQVLIDGKPSALMSGDNRAAALQDRDRHADGLSGTGVERPQPEPDHEPDLDAGVEVTDTFSLLPTS